MSIPISPPLSMLPNPISLPASLRFSMDPHSSSSVPPPTAVPSSPLNAAAPSNPTSANHPPYAKMIRTAIATLNHRNGSSKKAISDFIEQTYPNLPSTHPDLLTHNLDHLKSNGLLVMVKRSYKLPQSDAFPSPAQRKRGRPPKSRPLADLQPQPQPYVRQNANPEDEPANPQPKRRAPGRPPKGDQPEPSARRGRPPGSKSPGRRPKPKSVPAFSNVTKRPPGRPPKNQTSITVIPFAPPSPDAPATTVTASTVPAVPPDIISPITSSRGRGRPKKNAAAAPPSGAAPQVVGAGRGGVMTPKDPARRSVGRPKKGTSVEDELRSKLEYIQLKINESLGAIKPHFSIASPVSAIAAIQELERLATMDFNAPLRNETQELPPQQ